MSAASSAALRLLVDDLEGVGIGVVDADLLRRERMLDDLVFDAVEGQRAGGVEAQRLQIAREHLHRRHAAAFHRRDEIGAGRERKIAGAPEAEPRGIGEVLRRRGAGGRDIEDARVGQRVLQAQPRQALLRGLLLAALALVAGGVGHGVGLVEDDDAVEVAAQPVDDLLHAGRLLAARLRAQGGVGGEEDALVERDRRALAEARQRHDVGAVAADRGPVALGVLDQLVGFGEPDRAAAALGQLSRMMPAIWRPLPPPVPSPRNQPRRKRTAFVGIVGRGRDEIVGLVDGVGAGEMAGMRFAGIDDAFELRVRQDAGGEKARRQMRPVGRAAAGRPRPSPPTGRAWSDAAARRRSGSPAAHSPRRGSRSGARLRPASTRRSRRRARRNPGSAPAA